MKLKQFKVEPKLESCSICGKEEAKLSSIRVGSYDTSRGYVGSGRPIIDNYKVRLCKKCFPKLVTKLRNLILD